MIETAEKPPVTSYIGNALGVAKTLDTYGLDGAAETLMPGSGSGLQSTSTRSIITPLA
jgi:hypothetical protein